MRIVLEAMQWKENTFLTLTYDDENLPEDKSVSPEHLKLFMYRLRQSIKPRRIRFFGVGEYGDETERPHYHLALFNHSNCVRGKSYYTKRNPNSCCPVCDAVADTWSKGNVLLGTLTIQSARYIANYTTKKMTRADDSRLKGRHPEFARMSNGGGKSNLGGIGASAISDIASELLDHVKSPEEVPQLLTFNGKVVPLGRYLVRKLRKELGFAEETPEALLLEQKETLRALREAAENSPEMAHGRLNDLVKSELVKQAKPKAIRLEKLDRLYRKEKPL